MRIVGTIGAIWGGLGVFGLLGFAIYRLSWYAVEAFTGGLAPWQWLVAIAYCAFMAYTEGYRGFQLRFSPRTAARFRYLRDRPNLLRTLVAPAFSMGYIHAPRRTRIAAIGLTLLIVGFVVAVRRLDQPWRGIVDSGVVVGLTWGVLTLAWWTARVFATPHPPASPEVPNGDV